MAPVPATEGGSVAERIFVYATSPGAVRSLIGKPGQMNTIAAQCDPADVTAEADMYTALSYNVGLLGEAADQ